MPTIGGLTLLLSKAGHFEEAQRVWTLDCWIVVLRCRLTVVDAHDLTAGPDLQAGRRQHSCGTVGGGEEPELPSLLHAIHYILKA